jgi:hypothetical protein
MLLIEGVQGESKLEAQQPSRNNQCKEGLQNSKTQAMAKNPTFSRRQKINKKGDRITRSTTALFL